ncbi:hypothetical protein SLEP1_g53863 [Rubroshorea leprosula]|uniref:Uncharacterized protein n=1 Tax=Rubroshorea leprosula TaxID=152421 RepID=A0AAV5MCH0_9ROSI|nr:hypothetical protein SLEP1_g53863 [Rubroshorea leprosula]
MLQKLEGNWIIYEILFTDYCLSITVHGLLYGVSGPKLNAWGI